jgi:hypothetical protein
MACVMPSQGDLRHEGISRLFEMGNTIPQVAIFSTRRQAEITKIAWADFECEAGRQMVRDMKNLGDKIGNDVTCEVPPEAIAIMGSMPKTTEKIFPYSPGEGHELGHWCRARTLTSHLFEVRHQAVQLVERRSSSSLVAFGGRAGRVCEKHPCATPNPPELPKPPCRSVCSGSAGLAISA